MFKLNYKAVVLAFISVNLQAMEYQQPEKMDVEIKNIQVLPDELLFAILENVIMSSSQKISDIPKQYTKLKVNKKFKTILENKSRSRNVEKLANLVDDIKSFLKEYKSKNHYDFDINCLDSKNNVLQICASLGYKHLAEFLVDKGADVNFKNGHSDSVLHYAACSNRTEMVKFLIGKKADINILNQKEPQETPIYFTAVYDSLEAAKLLIEYGAEINGKYSNGYTVLHRAIWNNAIKLAKLLVDNNADLTIKWNGFTPLDYAKDFAKKMEHHETVDYQMVRHQIIKLIENKLDKKNME